MNVTKLFLRSSPDIALTAVKSLTSSISRTHEQLRNNVLSLCDCLARLGVREGDNVLLISGGRMEAIEAVLATFNLGATAVPVSPLIGTANLLSIIERMNPACCIVEEFQDPAVEAMLRRIARVRVSLRKPANREQQEQWLHYPALVSDCAETSPVRELEGSRRALIIHSSGSSGVPKAIAFSHENLGAFFDCHTQIHDQYADGEALRRTAIVTALPPSHLAGLAMVLQGLLSERPTYLLSHFIPELYLKLIERVRCSYIVLAPSLYRSLLAEPYQQRMDTSVLRFCVQGGEPCSDELAARIEAAFGARVVTAYSMTEALSGFAHTRQRLFGAEPIPLTSCGENWFGEVRLVDPYGRQSDSFGELWVRNRTVHACYLDEHLNDERLVDGWFRTRDLFFRDAQGHFFHRGRVDEMFICNGRNIFPSELEFMLMRHPAIEAACATPVTSPEKGTVPAVLLVSRSAVNETEILDFCMKHGSSHCVPQWVQFASALPLLSAGKLDRVAVARVLQQSYDARTSAPVPALAHTLAQ